MKRAEGIGNVGGKENNGERWGEKKRDVLG
jgi:hypothetical protein